MPSPHGRFGMGHSSAITVIKLGRNSTLRKPCSQGAKRPIRCLVAVGIGSHDSKKAAYQMKDLIAVLEHPVNCTAIDNQVLANDGIRVVAAEQRAKCPEIVRIR
jgi:hypothetical protein